MYSKQISSTQCWTNGHMVRDLAETVIWPADHSICRLVKMNGRASPNLHSYMCKDLISQFILTVLILQNVDSKLILDTHLQKGHVHGV